MTRSVKKMLAEMLSVRGLTLDACIESSDITDVEARKLMKLVAATFKPIIMAYIFIKGELIFFPTTQKCTS